MPWAAEGLSLGSDNECFRQHLRQAHPETEEAMVKQREACVKARRSPFQKGLSPCLCAVTRSPQAQQGCLPACSCSHFIAYHRSWGTSAGAICVSSCSMSSATPPGPMP